MGLRDGKTRVIVANFCPAALALARADGMVRRGLSWRTFARRRWRLHGPTGW
ncbi:hypothetical protein [Superficieibacter electus]|uniref:hypothetical protein n=1 Tax=Superficieibacter electus TaxID=2022662 RepID=UPI00159EC10A|nr:hypothetical protein [Superficieibacter electus]